MESCDDSGYQEMTLSSLSTSDYPQLTGLCDTLEEFCEARHVNLSLPSLRADNFSMELMQRLRQGGKTGLTFAPEAGTQRLRDVINKNVTQEDLLASCRTAFAGGYSAVKLYFMLGLPTETDEDVLGIADLAARVMHAVARERDEQEPRRAHHRVDVVVRAETAHRLSVAGADHARGVRAPRQASARGDQDEDPLPTTGTTRTRAFSRPSSPAATAVSGRCWKQRGVKVQSLTHGRSISPSSAGSTLSTSAALTRRFTPTATVRAMRSCRGV